MVPVHRPSPNRRQHLAQAVQSDQATSGSGHAPADPRNPLGKWPIRKGLDIWSENSLINLQNARIGAIQSSLEAWKFRSNFVSRNLEGLQFERLSGGFGGKSLEQESASSLVDWIQDKTTDQANPKSFSPTPYIATAAALRSAGRFQQARDIRIALENRHTKSLSAFNPTKALRFLLIGPVTAYGYKPFNSLLWLFLLVVISALIGLSYKHPELSSLKELSLKEWASWLSYSAENAIPLFELDPIQDTFLEDQFSPSRLEQNEKPYDHVPSVVRLAFMLERLLGLVILTTLVAGLTGWAERRGEE